MKITIARYGEPGKPDTIEIDDGSFWLRYFSDTAMGILLKRAFELNDADPSHTDLKYVYEAAPKLAQDLLDAIKRHESEGK